AGAATDAAAKIATLTFMIILINAAWLMAGASLAPLLRDRRWSRVINVTLAAALVGATALPVAHQVYANRQNRTRPKPRPFTTPTTTKTQGHKHDRCSGPATATAPLMLTT